MSAGPYPTKELFAPIDRVVRKFATTVTLGGPPWTRLEPAYGLSGGPQVLLDDPSYDEAASPTPIKTLDIEWRGVNTTAYGITLHDLSETPLTDGDIEAIECLPLSEGDPYPRGYQPRVNQLVYAPVAFSPDRPSWILEFIPGSENLLSRMIAFGENFGGLQATSARIRLTFSGAGTSKLRVSNALTASHPGLRTVARDAQGNDLNLNIAAGLLRRRNDHQNILGALPPQAFPVVSAPTPVTVGTLTGLEIVWPPDGAPYLHVFKQGSGNGQGEHYHLSLTPGLPQ